MNQEYDNIDDYEYRLRNPIGYPEDKPEIHLASFKVDYNFLIHHSLDCPYARRVLMEISALIIEKDLHINKIVDFSFEEGGRDYPYGIYTLRFIGDQFLIDWGPHFNFLMIVEFLESRGVKTTSL